MFVLTATTIITAQLAPIQECKFVCLHAPQKLNISNRICLGIPVGTRRYPLPTSIQLPNCNQQSCQLVPGQNVELTAAFRSNIATSVVHVRTSIRINDQWQMSNLDLDGCSRLVDRVCPLHVRTDVVYRNAAFQIQISPNTTPTQIMIECTGNQFYPLWCARIDVTLQSSYGST